MKYLWSLVPAVVAVLVTYELNLKGPDLRYQLSSPIPTDAELAGPARVIQQIEIANVGKVVAQKVQVKILTSVAKLVVFKDSQTDNYTWFDKAVPQELMYDSLRPGGRVRIVLTGTFALAERDIEIRHLEGTATTALASGTSLPSLLLVFFFVGSIVFYLWSSARTLEKDFLASRARWQPEEVLGRRKPLLLSEKDWAENLERAASGLAEKTFRETADVASWEVYKLLNSERPKQLPGGVWDKVVPVLGSGLISRMEKTASQAQAFADAAEIRKLLATPRPVGVFEEPWMRLMNRLGDAYVIAVVSRRVRRYSSTSDLAKTLAEPKPDRVGDATWDDCQRWLRSLYFASLVDGLRTSTTPAEYLKSADLSRLPRSEADALKALAYHLERKKVPDVTTPSGAAQFLREAKPPFMSEEEYERLTKTAQTIKSITEDERHVSALLGQVKSLLMGRPLPSDAPTGILQDEWSDLKKTEQEIVTARRQNEQRQGELSALESETSTLKATVLRQLQIINTFISDPGVLDRIEEYEGVFAPGNLASLKELAALRRKLAGHESL